MIATLIKGKGARGLLDYLLGERDHNGDVRERVAVLGGTMPGDTPRDLAKGFGMLHATRPTLGTYVCHAILSWDSASGDKPDDEAQLAMMRDHMAALGFEDYVVVSHGDHVHGAACRIKRDGSVVSDRWDFRRGEESCRALEVKYGLAQLQSSHLLEPERTRTHVSTLSKGELGLIRRNLESAGVEPVGAAFGKAAALSSLYGSVPPGDVLASLRFVDRAKSVVVLKDGSRIQDLGTNLVSSTDSVAAARLMAHECGAKGWHTVRIKGSHEFRERMWLEAKRVGVEPTGHTPSAALLEAWTREQAEREAMPAIDPRTPFEAPASIIPEGIADAPELPAFPSKPQLADAVQAARDAALAAGGTIGEFIENVERLGLCVRPNWSPATGKVTGLSFFIADDLAGVEVSGSKLGRSLSWANLLKGGLGYEFERDGPRLGAASERAAVRRPGREAGRTESQGDTDLGRVGGGVPANSGHDGGLAPIGGPQPSGHGRHDGPPAIDVEPPGIRDEPSTQHDAGSGRIGIPGRSGGDSGTLREGSGSLGNARQQVSGDDARTGNGSQGDPGRGDGSDNLGIPGGRQAAGNGPGKGGEGDRIPGSSDSADGRSRSKPHGSDSGDRDWIGPAYERVVALGGVADGRLAYTLKAVRATVESLGAEKYLVGVMPPKGMKDNPDLRPVNKHYTAAQLLAEGTVKFLRAMNAKGYDIYVRPEGNEDGTRPPVILLDDLTPADVDRLRADGFEPCLVGCTSAPDRLQAWVRVGPQGASLTLDEAREVSRALARRYGGDPGAAKSEQFGRLFGYTNRKPIRMQENGGAPPFAKVLAFSRQVATSSAALLTEARQAIQAERLATLARAGEAAQRVRNAAMERNREAASDSLYRHWLKASGGPSANNQSSVDFAAACGALRDGHSFEAVKEALRRISPDLEARKSDVEDYLERTIQNARKAIDSDGRGANVSRYVPVRR